MYLSGIHAETLDPANCPAESVRDLRYATACGGDGSRGGMGCYSLDLLTSQYADTNTSHSTSPTIAAKRTDA